MQISAAYRTLIISRPSYCAYFASITESSFQSVNCFLDMALPVLTTLIGTGGLTIGLLSFLQPRAAARIYGMSVKTAGLTFTDILAREPQVIKEKAYLLRAHDISYIHALSIRNLTAGLTILVLTAYWQFGLASATSEVRDEIQRALGVVVLIGSAVPVMDAWICWSASEATAKYHARAVKASMVRSPNTSVRLAKKAAMLHATRSIFWVSGGLWCLLS